MFRKAMARIGHSREHAIVERVGRRRAYGDDRV